MTHTLVYGWKGTGGASPISKPVAVTAAGAIDLAPEIAIGATDQAVAMTLTVAAIEGLFIAASADLTMKTNSAATPAQTFALKAGIPLQWHPLAYFANPFTTNITGLYFTNASGQLVIPTIKVLYNP